MVPLDRLKTHIPDAVLGQIPDCMQKFNIDTSLRLAHFLAQCAHESMNFKATEENLNYSASALKRVFSKYFPGDLADSYARQPEKIASRVYGGRMGNGDEASKEGYKYRGRGYIQLTGKDNYRNFSAASNADVVDNPDLVKTTYPLLSAAWFWGSRKLNPIADQGDGDEVVEQITRKVNGGLNGLDDRIAYFKKYYAALS